MDFIKHISSLNIKFEFVCISDSYCLFVQVHKLDSSTWQNVTVVPIDIADRSQVSAAVSRNSFGTFAVQDRNTVWRLHVDKPDH